MNMLNPFNWMAKKITRWITQDREPAEIPPCDFERMSCEIRPCDVLLVEGRARVSEVIKTITQSQWTHSALYIGRLHEIADEATREHVSWFYDGDPAEQLVIEPVLGKGTIVAPLSKYTQDHVRICRPRGLTRPDMIKVISFTAQHLGRDYDVRQLLDLARFLFPYGFVPRRWRSSLFEHNVGKPTRTVCSTLIAGAFASVHFPVLPVLRRENGAIKFYRRNTSLYVPRDFDTSPYFEIIKYPVLGVDDIGLYRQLPWDTEGVICNDAHDCYIPAPAAPEEDVVDHAPPVLAKKAESSH